ncbi:P1 family peptidase, partial [Ilumatobacter sp.]|uniref:P1 family peptidase n=1 Tax=Ilumatobacter sp. TaxID=1967498 RepID=UPI003C66AEC7
QGGVGTASVTITIAGVDVCVGAIAVVNAHGSPIDRSTGLPWERGGLAMKRPSATQRRAVHDALAAPPTVGLNTTIGVVATTARLDKAECSKVASVAHDGLARAIRPAHSMTDGDTVFTLATGGVALPGHDEGRVGALNQILEAAADVFAAACTHAVITATAIGDAPAWRDLCPHTLDSC